MEKLNIKKSDVVESPKDELLNGVIIEANKTTWAEIISPDKIMKFEEPNKAIVQVKYEVEFNGTHFKGEDTFAYYDKPMSNSKLGQYLLKYDSFEPGTKVKVLYDVQGFGKIKVD